MSYESIGQNATLDNLYNQPSGTNYAYVSPDSLYNEDTGELLGNFSQAANAIASQDPINGVSWLTNLTQSIPSVITGLSALQLSQINVQRAAKGLAPLNAAAYSPQVGVNLAPGTMTTIMYVAAGLAAVFLLAKR